uniref:Kinesin motor domain-containing protein n=1 Tax=Macrostomum lignano TaxID=282301 RepID=A0A1I8FPR0_9PLAT
AQLPMPIIICRRLPHHRMPPPAASSVLPASASANSSEQCDAASGLGRARLLALRVSSSSSSSRLNRQLSSLASASQPGSPCQNSRSELGQDIAVEQQQASSSSSKQQQRSSKSAVLSR